MYQSAHMALSYWTAVYAEGYLRDYTQSAVQPGLFTAQTHIREGGVQDRTGLSQIYGNRKLRTHKTVSPVFSEQVSCGSV